MNCFEKLLFVCLTALITYETWYNFRGAMELGDSHMDLTSLAYSTGSLFPAIGLGVHASKLAFAKNDEARKTLADSCFYKLISYFYAAIFGLFILAKIILHFEYFN